MKSIKTTIRNLLPEDCKAYFVGGYVRDKTLGIFSKDIDVTVVGSTPAQMEAKGFQRVGKAFEVFIHPDLGHDFQFALARKENSTGAGHTDFECVYEGVTLMDDLKRRDFTMNAMAIDLDDENETYIDPFGGRVHLTNRTLEIVGEHFSEDPLRMMRGFRFAVKYGLRPSTAFFYAVNKMRVENAHKTLSNERINEEVSKVVNTCSVADILKWLSYVTYNLGECNHPLFATIRQMPKLEQDPKYHPEGNVFVHTLDTVGHALTIYRKGLKVTSGNKDLTPTVEQVFYAALCHDLGKVLVADQNEPMKYHKHDTEEVSDQVYSILKESRLPKNICRLCKRVARYHTHVHDFDKLNAKTLIKMQVTPSDAVTLALVAEADALAARQSVDSRYTRFMFMMLKMPTLRGNAVHLVPREESNWMHKVHQQQISLVKEERRKLFKLTKKGLSE